MKKASLSPKNKINDCSGMQAVSENKDSKDFSNLRANRKLSFTSQMIAVKVGPLQNEKPQEKETRREKQIVFDNFQGKQLTKEKVSLQSNNPPSRNFRENQDRKKQKITLYTLQKYIRDSWEKRPVDDLHHFYFRCKKISELLDPQFQQYINVNKKWCSNLLKKFKAKQSKPSETGNQQNEHEPKTVSDTFYEMLSEPQSLQMEKTVSNTSQVWRKHILKMLQQKYSLEKTKSQNQNDMAEPEVIVINQKMKKTFENWKEQLNRLQNDFLAIHSTQPRFLKCEEHKEEVPINTDLLQNKTKKVPKKKQIYASEEMKKGEKLAFRISPREMKMQAFKKSEHFIQDSVDWQYKSRAM